MSPAKVGILFPQPPDGTVGGAERLWRSLGGRISGRGHHVELVGLDFPESTFAEVLDGYEQFARYDASRFDVLITGKYPAWMARHDRHLLYLLHPLRGLYDTYPASLAPLNATSKGRDILVGLDQGSDPIAVIESVRSQLAQLGSGDPLVAYPGPLARWAIHHLDSIARTPQRIKRFATISEVVASRPDYVPVGHAAMISHPESDLPIVRGERQSPNRFFTTSRHDGPKRLDLVIEAFKRMPDRTAELRIAGDGPLRGELERLAADDHRITFLGQIDETTLASEYAAATAVPFVPFDEDYGYVSLEAMRAGTPVVTTTDGGGAKELIEHGVNGLVVRPEPDSVRWGLQHVAESARTRWQMSLNARRRASRVTWEPLLDEIDALADPVRERPRVLMVSTYPIEPMVGGGQRRARHLARAMARYADVTVLVSAGHDDSDPAVGTKRRHLELGLTQVEVPRSEAQRRAEDDMYFALGKLPVDDVTSAILAPATPEFIDELDRQVASADVIVLTHPFLAPAIPPTDVPIIHDSHNSETSFKADLLPDTDGGRWLLDLVRQAETEATRRAALITACTTDDLQQLRELDAGRSIPGVVVPNGVDASSLPLKTADEATAARSELLALAGFAKSESRPLGIFVGSWHPPNIRAGRLVIELARTRDDWIFILAGSHTSEFAEADSALASSDLPDNVLLVPVFSESLLWPLIAGADVALNPMASGGGSNLKLFDYLAVGTPVLTTPVGARGVDNPEQFVTVVEPDLKALSDGLDAVSGRDPGEAQSMVERGRQLVVDTYDWAALGDTWATSILEHSAITPRDGAITLPTPRSPTVINVRPPLASTPPPSADPVVATMELIGRRALTTAPTPQETTMDPMLREHLKFADENRHVGRVLPDTARFTLPKKAVIRVGHVLSNEQANYNEAVVNALQKMASDQQELMRSMRAMQEQMAALTDANRALARRVEFLENQQRGTE